MSLIMFFRFFFQDYRDRKERRSRSRSSERRDDGRRERDTRESRNPVHGSSRPSNQAINQQRHRQNDRSPPRHTNNDSPQWGRPSIPRDPKPMDGKEEEKKDKPNFALSGKLLEDTNKVNGVVITYAQPPEARNPKVRWRLYPFKGEEVLPTMYIHRQSAYLLGRDRRVADIPLDHPSCSKQHAVIQFRLVTVAKPDGSVTRRVKPYIIDLNSGNGTMVNGKRIEPQRYVELLEKDVVKFGFSSREYVMLHEGSKDDEYHSGEEAEDEEEGKPRQETKKSTEKIKK